MKGWRINQDLLAAKYEPGCILLRSEQLRKLQINTFNSLPDRMARCSACRGIVKATAGLAWFSDLPHGMLNGIHESCQLPLPLEINRMLQHPELKSEAWSMFFDLFSLSSRALEALPDLKHADPSTLCWRVYPNNGYKHFSLHQDQVDALAMSKSFWETAAYLLPQVQDFANLLFGRNLKTETKVLRACMWLYFQHQPVSQKRRDETDSLLSFLPDLIEGSHSQWLIVRCLSLMHLGLGSVSRETFAPSSAIYRFASLLTMDLQIERESLLPSVQHLVTAVVEAWPGLELSDAWRAAYAVHSVVRD
jgi:hypothetical protein